MRTLIAIVALLVSANVWAPTAFLVDEVDTGGMTKQCIYEYLGDTYVRTIQSMQLCPMTIQVE